MLLFVYKLSLNKPHNYMNFLFSLIKFSLRGSNKTKTIKPNFFCEINNPFFQSVKEFE